MTTNGVRHFLDLIDIPKPVLAGLVDKSRSMKAGRGRGQMTSPLAGKTLAMIFDKPSTRTRVSFDVAMGSSVVRRSCLPRRKCNSVVVKHTPTPRVCSRAMSMPL